MALSQGRLGDELLSKAQQEAHKLAGALGTFGFAEGSRLAQAIEQQLQVVRTSLNQAQSLHLYELTTKLQQEFLVNSNGESDQ